TLGTTTAYATMENAEGDTISSTDSTGDGAPVTINVNPSLESIRVDPENVSIVGVNTANVTAWGIYDNDSTTEVDITNLVSWNVVDETIAVISNGPEASDGIGGVVSNGAASDGITTATAELDGITSSNAVNIAACNTLAGPCIDVFDTTIGDGSGKLYTNSPSKAYIDSIGGSAHSGVSDETGVEGPSGRFYTFNWTNANKLCDTYSSISLGGRTNWSMPTLPELKQVRSASGGDMFITRGWPVTPWYWSSTSASSTHAALDLGAGGEVYPYGSGDASDSYASCVSTP
ncbi:DUF1566 domain-containing protein, partial [Vibrio alginolyticus]|nr:DUF1566 domain-containing protein [Vibrio alginolyticus]